MNILLLILIPIVSGLFEFVEDNNRWNSEGLLNINSFGKDSIEALRTIVPKKNTFNEKKRAFFEFCRVYGPENRTAIVSLSNKLIYVYKNIPENFQKLAEETLAHFEAEQYFFDVPSFEKISAKLDEAYDKGNLMAMWNSKQDFDKNIPFFKKVFYSPFQKEDIEKESTEIGKKVIQFLIYVFGSEEVNTSNRQIEDEL